MPGLFTLTKINLMLDPDKGNFKFFFSNQKESHSEMRVYSISFKSTLYRKHIHQEVNNFSLPTILNFTQTP